MSGDADGEALEMAFSKKKVDDRKTWLQGFAPGTFLDHTASAISYSDFVHKVRPAGFHAQPISGQMQRVALALLSISLACCKRDCCGRLLDSTPW
jgi:hypothetical protein